MGSAMESVSLVPGSAEYAAGRAVAVHLYHFLSLMKSLCLTAH